ncbi:hypothetical protein SMD44_01004 [Streptomyces alboflavus]|uniref:Uncharacterized protein n=1 Tax=Streptomyces alboflavus TaxID=67267 RepID=A0A1Z1W5A4_9ACTN|nr:hypothetical protein [Streptomyces alboflavus]ARX81606.1 hypothetical protein SMD44_01004 [Streptomyces alboflavus]
MSALTPELIADVEESFLGFWDDAVMDIVRQPYTVGALAAYAWRDGGSHIPSDDSEGGGDDA